MLCCDIQGLGSETDPSSPALKARAAVGGIMVWGMLSWHILDLSVLIENYLRATAFMCIVAEQVHPFMTTFQQDNSWCQHGSNNLKLVSEHEKEFALLQWPPWLPDFSPNKHLWDLMGDNIHIITVQSTNLSKSIWTKKKTQWNIFQ